MKKSHQIFLYKCGCEFDTNKRNSKGKINNKLCKQHQEPIVKKILHCVCGRKQILNQKYTNGITRCKKCREKVLYAWHFDLSKEKREEAKKKNIYVFNCGCVMTYHKLMQNKTKTKTNSIKCPKHKALVKTIKINCVICGTLLIKNNRQATKLLCDKCKQDRIYGQKIGYAEANAEANVQPKSLLEFKPVSEIFIRKTNCWLYKYCLFDTQKFDENKAACHGCKRFEKITGSIVEYDINYQNRITNVFA